MPQQVKITVGNISLRAEFGDTETTKAIINVLPIETSFNTWGDEFYFEIPVEMELDDTATDKVKVGDIGYWPTGNALAIFFGPTPMSTGDDPVPASKVNMVGKVLDDATQLRNVKSESKIRIERTS